MSVTETDRLNEAFALAQASLHQSTMPRFRYFQKRNGPMFSWTTEQVEGRYVSFVHVPVGAGSRSGKAREWQMVDDSIAAHHLRKDAKARALRLYNAWLEGDAKPW
jgi:hypothetical protein